jgi:2-hydroxy-3-keto-5-methylthiopentenyl-1-phosphate phosphatase
MSQPVKQGRRFAAVEIVCDFDGTISRPDTVDRILETLADPAWRAIEEEWARGDIDSRECMARQIPLIRGGWSAIARFLDEQVSLEPSFAAFAAWCASRALPLRIASEGIEQVIRHLLARERITVYSIWASRLLSGADGSLALDFSHATGRSHCGAALCKCEIFRGSPGQPLRVLIGDGRSDFCAAARADIVFARDALLDHCLARRIRCVRFETFETVQKVLERSILRPEFRAAEEPVARLAAER